jgi:hypothetical protein
MVLVCRQALTQCSPAEFSVEVMDTLMLSIGEALQSYLAE